MDGGKNLVLVYHLYHALDKNAAGDWQLHDWERVELQVQQRGGHPGSGESVAYAVVTQHKRNVVRPQGSADLNFMQTATGSHLLIWQAEWSDKLLARARAGAALRRRSRTPSSRGGWRRAAKAEADVNNDDGRKKLHYVFVPEGSAAAVAAFNAQPVRYATADCAGQPLRQRDLRQLARREARHVRAAGHRGHPAHALGVRRLRDALAAGRAGVTSSWRAPS